MFPQFYENVLEFSLFNVYAIMISMIVLGRNEEVREGTSAMRRILGTRGSLRSTGVRLSRVRDGRHGMTETPRNPGVRSLKHDDLSLPEPRRSNPSPEINGRQHKVCLTYIVKL